MKKSQKYKVVLGILLIAVAVAVAAGFLHGANVPVFEPKGAVGAKERNLMLFALALSVVVVVPVFTLLGVIAWKYRASNGKAKYRPDNDGNRKLEIIWWLIPGILILILSVVTWVSAHRLDPYKPLASSTKPLRVQVVALDWKWLFIYPEQHVASVNTLALPVDTPVNFEITADAPMNSFWIPQLGGQMYAMPGMSTQLHLIADKAGSYDGSSANISGKGFAGMKFVADATSRADFDRWIQRAQAAPRQLDKNSYGQLAKPSENNPPETYALADNGLYNYVVMKYMAHNPAVHTHEHADHDHDDGDHESHDHDMEAH